MVNLIMNAYRTILVNNLCDKAITTIGIRRLTFDIKSLAILSDGQVMRLLRELDIVNPRAEKGRG